MGGVARWGSVVAVALTVALGGCAYVTAVPAPPGSNVSGIRVYDVKPLLIVNAERVTIEMVPNYNRAYALQFGAFLAKNNVDITMQHGLLTNVKADMDTTDFINIIAALIEKIPEPGDAFTGDREPRSTGGVQDRFQVYDIIFDDDGNLLGLRPLVSQADLLHVKTTRAQVIPAPTVTGQPSPESSTIRTGPIN